MKKKLVKKFQHFSFGAQFMVIAYLVALLVISYNINALQDEVKEALADTQHTQKLANDLLQSSEDLTRMSRTYVSTGNPTYKHAFFESSANTKWTSTSSKQLLSRILALKSRKWRSLRRR